MGLWPGWWPGYLVSPSKWPDAQDSGINSVGVHCTGVEAYRFGYPRIAAALLRSRKFEDWEEKENKENKSAIYSEGAVTVSSVYLKRRYLQ